MDQILIRPLNWAENASARLEKSHASTSSRALNQAFFLIVAEAFTYLAIAYHAAGLAAKALPMTARHILLHTPLAKAQQLGNKIPEWATWNSLKQVHANPLKRSLFFSPLIKSFTQSSRAIFTELKQKALYLPPVSVSTRDSVRKWSRVALVTTLTLSCVAATALVLAARFVNSKSRASCERSGRYEWVVVSKLFGTGFCHNTAEMREKMAACEANGGYWLSDREINVSSSGGLIARIYFGDTIRIPHPYAPGDCLPVRDYLIHFSVLTGVVMGQLGLIQMPFDF